MKRLIAVLLVWLLILPGCTEAVNQPKTEHTNLNFEGTQGFRLVATDGNLKLYAEESTAQIMVADEKSRTVWKSTPDGSQEDQVANNLYRMNMLSQIHITYLNSMLSTDDISNFAGSVNQKTYTVRSIKNGIRFDFDFTYEGFVVPVEYYLEDGVFYASVVLDEIKEYKDNIITDISLLPYFGAAESDSPGYLMIPDGCGALITNGKGKEAGKYTGYVYGRDPVYTQTAKPLARQQALTLPVFGIKSGEAALLGIIESGAALCRVTATPAMLETSYANVYPTVTLRTVDTAVLQEMTGSARNVVTYNPYKAELGRFTVGYRFLNGSDADYNGMASVVRNWLFEGSVQVNPVRAGVFLELTASIRQSGSFLAIPIETVRPLVTFSRVFGIIDELAKDGIEGIKVKLDGWQSGGLYYRIPLLSNPEKKLGSRKTFREIITSGNVVPSFDYINIYSSGNGVSKKGDGVRNVSGGLSEQTHYFRSTFTKNKQYGYWTLLKSEIFSDLISKLVWQYPENARNTGYFDESSGNILPSDGHRNSLKGIQPTDRNAALQNYLSAYRRAVDYGLTIYFNNPYAYALPFASGITRLKNTSSGYTGFDAEIPFLQMIIHGRAVYSGSPLNESPDFKRSLLRAAEYGELPFFSLTEFDEEDMRLTGRLSDKFSSTYSYWRGKIMKAYGYLSPVIRAVDGAVMISHRKLDEGVYLVTYDNGAQVAVNYSANAVLTEIGTVEAESYIITGAGSARMEEEG